MKDCGYVGGLAREMTPEERLQQKRLAASSGYGKPVAHDIRDQVKELLAPLTDWELREVMALGFVNLKPEDADKAELITEIVRSLVRDELEGRN